MLDQPNAEEILEVVARMLREQLTGQVPASAAFQARVAANALDLVRRQIADGDRLERESHARLRALLGHDGQADALERELCERIRERRLDASTTRPARPPDGPARWTRCRSTSRATPLPPRRAAGADNNPGVNGHGLQPAGRAGRLSWREPRPFIDRDQAAAGAGRQRALLRPPPRMGAHRFRQRRPAAPRMGGAAGKAKKIADKAGFYRF
jgi:hypothetical protein